MVEDIFTLLNEWLTGNFLPAFVAAFLWGVLSVLLSPCHLSSIPLIVGFVNSQDKISAKSTFTTSIVFSFGILITIALIGLITASMGRLLGNIGSIGNYLVAIIFFIIGLYLLDVIRLPYNSKNFLATKQKGLTAALILGLLFGLALGPCTFAYMAPVLGVVFQVSSTDLLFAIILLLAFGIGHCAVIAGAGTLTSTVQLYLNWNENSNITKWIKRGCGVLVIIGGIYLITII